MIGSIIELPDGKLKVIIGMKNNEDMGSCAYDRVYKVVDYSPDVDEFNTSKYSGYEIVVKGVTKLPFIIREDIYPYEYIGKSEIKGVKTRFYERDWSKLKPKKQPTR